MLLARDLYIHTYLPLTDISHWRILKPVIFIETTAFTRQVRELLSDEEYGALQQAMIERPEAGALIQDTGGLRKLRWARAGSGKRGGVRVIYYWLSADHQIRLLMVYAKSTQGNLSAAEKKALRAIVERWNG